MWRGSLFLPDVTMPDKVFLGRTWGLVFPAMGLLSITVVSAAAPEASLSFLFWGAGLFVLPVIAIYTIAVYWLFPRQDADGVR
jgi:cytochrome bd-type quinol oxidase subunit 2